MAHGKVFKFVVVDIFSSASSGGLKGDVLVHLTLNACVSISGLLVLLLMVVDIFASPLWLMLFCVICFSPTFF